MRKTRRVAANLSWRLVTTNQSAQSEEEVSMSKILADEIFQKLYLNHSWVQLGIYGIANFLTSLPNPSSAPVWELRHEPAHGAASDFRVRNMALSENVPKSTVYNNVPVKNAMVYILQSVYDHLHNMNNIWLTII